jgi:pyridinium-3,5-bisthiocarboxylic acid mononucleotide nickel chelatase
MRIGYLECFAGISGDMLMGALVDAGVPFDFLKDAVRSLGLGADLRVSKVNRSGIQSTKIDVLVGERLVENAAESGAHASSDHDHRSANHPHAQGNDPGKSHQHSGGPEHDHDHDHAQQHHHDAHDHAVHGHHGRNLTVIRKILDDAPLSARARAFAVNAFELLGQAEAHIHGIPIEQVHFHEVGAVDAIVDIVCCAVAVDTLALDRWYASAVNVGAGFVQCAHGRFPVPAPATAELLKGLPVYSAGPQVEMVTPTGAALLRALQCSFESPGFGSLGVVRSKSIGYGAGTRDPKQFPNVLRLTIGETAGDLEAPGKSRGSEVERVTVIECAIDDLSPQLLAHTAQLALERGALDVMSAPVTMKKGRLGTLLTVLAKPADAAEMSQLLFRETTTLGMRMREEDRLCLTRELVPVETEYGVVRLKIGSWEGEDMNAAPEFEDCRRAAEACDVPVKVVMQAAVAQWRRDAETARPARLSPEARRPGVSE